MRFVSTKLSLNHVIHILPILTWWFCTIVVSIGFVIHRLHSLTRGEWVGLLLFIVFLANIKFTYYKRFTPSYFIFTEWTLVFPLTVGCSISTYYFLTNRIETEVIWASLIHGLLFVAWYIQYRFTNLQTQEYTKLNTQSIPLIITKYGYQKVIHLPAAYYLIAAFISLLATLQINHIFLLSSIISLIGAFTSWRTNLYLLVSITYHQVRMSLLIMTHVIILIVAEIFSN